MNEEFDFDGIILTLVGIVVAMILILGFITIIKNAFKPSHRKPAVDSSAVIRDQRMLMEDNKRKQQEMMRDLKQRIRDGQR